MDVFAYMYGSVSCSCSSFAGQKKTPNLLGLDLQDGCELPCRCWGLNSCDC